MDHSVVVLSGYGQTKRKLLVLFCNTSFTSSLLRYILVSFILTMMNFASNWYVCTYSPL